MLSVTGYLTMDRTAMLAALAAPLAAAVVLLPFRASWSNANVAVLPVVAVVGVTATGNRVAGALAAVWAAACFDFLSLLPYYRITIRGSADITTAVLPLLAGVAISQPAARARRLQVTIITDAGYLARIHQAASLTRSAWSPDAVVEHVREQLISLPGLEGSRFGCGYLLGHPPCLEPGGTITSGHGRRDVERCGRPAREIELRLRQRPALRPVHAQAPARLQAVAAAAAGRCNPRRPGRPRVRRRPFRPERALTTVPGVRRRRPGTLRRLPAAEPGSVIARPGICGPGRGAQ